MIDLRTNEVSKERGDDWLWVSIIKWAHEETIPLNGRLNGRDCQWFSIFGGFENVYIIEQVAMGILFNIEAYKNISVDYKLRKQISMHYKLSTCFLDYKYIIILRKKKVYYKYLTKQ